MFWRRFLIRGAYSLALVLAISAALGIGLLLESKAHIFSTAFTKQQPKTIEPFPVSVNAHTQVIEEHDGVNQFFTRTLASQPSNRSYWWNKVAAIFASRGWYQNLASPVSRIMVIWPGQRKEEIVKHAGEVLGWNKTERTEFMQLIDSTKPVLTEGKYFPGQYVTHRDATPAEIQQLIVDTFEQEVLARYTSEVAARVPFEQALIIASLLEREASDFNNMREISGVIWNRLFVEMPLQLDATLQYARGNDPHEPHWWPRVRPNDKFRTSPYNTYQNTGLPPAPIANPSAEAILAALNPIATDCFYYFHTTDGAYHCSKTYDGHVRKLRTIYGRGS